MPVHCDRAPLALLLLIYTGKNMPGSERHETPVGRRTAAWCASCSTCPVYCGCTAAAATACTFVDAIRAKVIVAYGRQPTEAVMPLSHNLGQALRGAVTAHFINNTGEPVYVQLYQKPFESVSGLENSVGSSEESLQSECSDASGNPSSKIASQGSLPTQDKLFGTMKREF